MSNGNGLPLHKRVHFRRIREIITEIAKYENYNPEDYDMFKMTVYETVGQNLKGKNVSYNIQGGNSCWVLDNKYDIFEVPSNWNKKGSPYGEFLFLAYNKSFQYYLFGYMKVELDKQASISRRYIVEDVYFKSHGKFDIIFEKYDNHITKVEYGSKFDPGVSSNEHTFDFDSFNTRKMAYHTDKYKILSSIDPSFRGTGDRYKVTGKQAVKVYKKNKPNNKNFSGNKRTNNTRKPFKNKGYR
jgi:hypothetical protein